MKILFISILLLITSTFSTGVFAEDHHSDAKSFKVSELKPGFYFLQGKGGNILVSNGLDGVLVVDSDYSEMSPALDVALSGIGGDLKYVLNTHWHGDHTQGNQFLGQKASIIAHDNVRKRLSSRQEVKLFNMVSEPYEKTALPSITFDQSLTLHFNDETIQALHLPHGHTDGDSIIFFKHANIVHMGDHFFNGFFPFVDVGSNGSVRGVANNVTNMLSSIDDSTIIVPGHGPVSNKKELIAFRDMLLGTAREVETMMAKSMSLEEIQAKGLDPQWKPWTDGFLNETTWIQIVHSSLLKDAEKQ